MEILKTTSDCYFKSYHLSLTKSMSPQPLSTQRNFKDHRPLDPLESVKVFFLNSIYNFKKSTSQNVSFENILSSQSL